MARVGVHEAKTKLSQLVKRAAAGEEIVVTRNGRPVARLGGNRSRKPKGSSRRPSTLP